MGLFGELIRSAGSGRDALLGQICEALATVDAKAAAHLALGGGALVEDGAPAEVLGRALVGPLERALVDAGRVIDAVDAMKEVEVEHDDDGPSTTTATRSRDRGQACRDRASSQHSPRAIVRRRSRGVDGHVVPAGRRELDARAARAARGAA